VFICVHPWLIFPSRERLPKISGIRVTNVNSSRSGVKSLVFLEKTQINADRNKPFLLPAFICNRSRIKKKNNHGDIANIRRQLPSGKLGVAFEEQAGKLLIKSITPGGPAEQAGFTPGSEILAVHEFGRRQSVLGRGVEKTVELLQGPAGTRVAMTVIPRGKRNEKLYEPIRRRGEINGEICSISTPTPPSDWSAYNDLHERQLPCVS